MADVSIDDLYHLSTGSDWVVRYRAICELIARKNADARLRVLLDQSRDEPVRLIKQTMDSGRYDLYPDVRPSANRDR